MNDPTFNVPNTRIKSNDWNFKRFNSIVKQTGTLYSANAFQSVDIYHVNFNILDSNMYNNICFWSKNSINSM